MRQRPCCQLCIASIVHIICNFASILLSTLQAFYHFKCVRDGVVWYKELISRQGVTHLGPPASIHTVMPASNTEQAGGDKAAWDLPCLWLVSWSSNNTKQGVTHMGPPCQIGHLFPHPSPRWEYTPRSFRHDSAICIYSTVANLPYSIFVCVLPRSRSNCSSAEEVAGYTAGSG